MLTPARKLAYYWLNLPWHKQVEIAGILGINEPKQRVVDGEQVFAKMVFIYARDNKQINQLWDLVMKESGENVGENPFKVK